MTIYLWYHDHLSMILETISWSFYLMTKGDSKWISADYLDPRLHRGAPTLCAEALGICGVWEKMMGTLW